MMKKTISSAAHGILVVGLPMIFAVLLYIVWSALTGRSDYTAVVLMTERALGVLVITVASALFVDIRERKKVNSNRNK